MVDSKDIDGYICVLFEENMLFPGAREGVLCRGCCGVGWGGGGGGVVNFCV